MQALEEAPNGLGSSLINAFLQKRELATGSLARGVSFSICHCLNFFLFFAPKICAWCCLCMDSLSNFFTKMGVFVVGLEVRHSRQR